MKIPVGAVRVADVKWRFALIVGLLVLAGASVRAEERQHHGVVFEEWVRQTFFDGYLPESYTQKWDVPAWVNTRHGGIPVNPKAVRYRSPVDLGDALRQFDINEPFWLVLGFWDDSAQGRTMVNVTAVRVEPEHWRTLWGGIKRQDLEHLDGVIKDRSLTPEQARRQAQEIKGRPPFSGATITVNPKIDEKGQRRLQCSLSFGEVFRRLAPEADPARQERPALWGVEFPGLVE